MTIGENIKRIRKEKGLTQKQLGELCNINEANIRKYENGKQNPKIETIDRIAFALDVKIVDIMGFEYFDSITDLDKLRKDISQLEQFEKLFISIYSKEEYDTFMQYSVLTEEGAKKVRAYINDIFSNPKYRIDI
jgi:transcriptional regulator with XRE-family HTH domain